MSDEGGSVGGGAVEATLKSRSAGLCKLWAPGMSDWMFGKSKASSGDVVGAGVCQSTMRAPGEVKASLCGEIWLYVGAS
jgi:hypothetical protein